MNISREEMKQEAIKRMKALDIFPSAIKQFKNNDIVMVSERPLGALYWANNEEKEMIRKFEEDNNALVYMIVRTNMVFGLCDSLLYVSQYPEEWEMDNEDIKSDIVMTYTVNHDAPYCSEFGSIGIQKRNGGLIRTA